MRFTSKLQSFHLLCISSCHENMMGDQFCKNYRSKMKNWWHLMPISYFQGKLLCHGKTLGWFGKCCPWLISLLFFRCLQYFALLFVPVCILQVKITWEVSSYIGIIWHPFKDHNYNSCNVPFISPASFLLFCFSDFVSEYLSYSFNPH